MTVSWLTISLARALDLPFSHSDESESHNRKVMQQIPFLTPCRTKNERARPAAAEIWNNGAVNRDRLSWLPGIRARRAPR
jgi:hypothetical protein